MALIQKTNPINEDVAIAIIQEQLYLNLTSNGVNSYESFERVYVTKGVPEWYIGNGNYKEVYFDNRFDLTSFFLLGNDKVEVEENFFEVDLAIIFQAKLNAIFPLITHRADSELHDLIKRSLDYSKTDFDLVNIVTGVENVYSGLTFDNSQYLDDVSHYHLVRFNLKLRYANNCSTFTPFACSPVTITDGLDIIEVASGGNYTCVGGVCADATYSIKDSAATVLYSGNIVSGGALNQTITDGVAVNSDSTFSLNVKAEGVGNIPDTTYNIYLDGVFDQSVSLPTLGNDNLTITLVTP